MAKNRQKSTSFFHKNQQKTHFFAHFFIKTHQKTHFSPPENHQKTPADKMLSVVKWGNAPIHN